ncbi:glucose-6-phosphate isomerase [Lysinibacillus composti]|uniref:Glucose-6-phosphate isomerase n=1 Tax=Lysinibacillus composti TaxID=720633 RepID=A0A3N9UHB0_9BACI|nr:glucose-6-phosphate isomerase [Lysinibacillus composti]MBM7609080.1 glucose-6-phosphate isomerase [Lysinibacillus composti]RQW75499.1 glucose-6-phosphate isomerase [Lysinibacillus composti]
MVNNLVQTTLLNCSLETKLIEAYHQKVNEIHRYLETTNDLTGWVEYPFQNHDNLLLEIENAANEIRTVADVLVVAGIGGSFLGARAIQDALTPYFGNAKNGIEVIYVGQNMSGAYINQLIDYIKDKEVYVNVISKSGGTMEPALAFRVMRQYMEERYGKESIERIIVTTDAEKGLLKKMADNSGYRQFVIPSDIGGRYSVLTPVGLLPIAVAGIDIRALMQGAKVAALEMQESDLEHNHAYQYAVTRHMLYEQGFKIELLASFEPSLNKFHEWWMQLFGESEGKQKKGLFPTCVNYSTDLHSIGQFIQDGSPILFETLLHFHEIEGDFSVPFDTRNEDGLNYLSNRTFNEINAISKQGTALAHADGGVPVIQLELPKLDAYHLGYLIYFFMKACAMSACLLEVNPFDQPGVEAYKRKMLELLQEEKVTT